MQLCQLQFTVRNLSKAKRGDRDEGGSGSEASGWQGKVCTCTVEVKKHVNLESNREMGLTRFDNVFVEAVLVEPHRPKLHLLPPSLLRPFPFIFSFLLPPPMLLILSFFFRAVMRRIGSSLC